MPRKLKGSIGKEIAVVRHSLRALDQSLARLVNSLRPNYESGERGSRPRQRRKLRLSPARLRGVPSPQVSLYAL